MADNAEDKLDEDFLFYLSFTKTFFSNLMDKQDIDLCQAWLHKLCGEPIAGVDNKRCRNVYLSQLVLSMQEGRMSGPFLQAPPSGRLAPPSVVFGPPQPDVRVQEPDWLQQVAAGSGGDYAHTSRDGRTYLATRTLDGGRGAFGYVAVTVADDEPLWCGGGEGGGGSGISTQTHQDLQQILSTRRSTEEQTKLVQLYRFLLANLCAVLEGKGEPHPHIVQLAARLEQELDKTMAHLPHSERRQRALLLLQDKLKHRMDNMLNREIKLDEAQKLLREADTTDASCAGTTGLSSLNETLWDDAVCQNPKKGNMKQLQSLYCEGIVQKFTKMLSEEKKKIVDRNRRHNASAVNAMKKELRDDVKEDLNKFVEARNQWNMVTKALREVKNCQAAACRPAAGLAPVTDAKDMSQNASSSEWRVIKQLTNQLKQSQKHYEDELRRGEELRLLIQAEHQSSHLSHSFNSSTILRLKQDNEELMANIHELQAEIKQEEDRLNDLLFIKAM